MDEASRTKCPVKEKSILDEMTWYDTVLAQKVPYPFFTQNDAIGTASAYQNQASNVFKA